MGKIIDHQEVADGKIKYSVLLDKREALLLRGNLKGIHLFSTSSPMNPARVLETGVKKSTKYFELPEELRIRHRTRRIQTEQTIVSCQIQKLHDRDVFIYVLQKNK